MSDNLLLSSTCTSKDDVCLTLRSTLFTLRSTYTSGDDLLVDLDGLVSEERWIAGGHLVHENSQGPPVHCLVVALQLVEYWNISFISISSEIFIGTLLRSIDFQV